MPAGDYSIKAEQGATFLRTFTWKDSDSVAIDITGYTAKMEVRSGPGTVIILTLTTENSRISISDPTNGIFFITVTAADMAPLVPGNYKYDLVMINGAVSTRLIQGAFIIDPEITD